MKIMKIMKTFTYLKFTLMSHSEGEYDKRLSRLNRSLSLINLTISAYMFLRSYLAISIIWHFEILIILQG